MFFREGQILDATTATASGDEAMMAILAWPEPEIEVLGGCRVRAKRVTRSLSELLLESCRIRDEQLSGMGPEASCDVTDPSASLPARGDSPSSQNKETNMNVQALNNAVDSLKADLGAGLLATDIFTSADGQTIAGYNYQPNAAALFCQITG